MKTFLIVLLAISVAKADSVMDAIPRNLYVKPSAMYKVDKPEKVVGGYVAAANSIPYQVGLFLTTASGTRYFCGGSLISKLYVLTAAHCVDGIIKIEVVLGAQNITQTETTQLRVITQTYTIHPGWNSKKILNDLAVIKFPTAIKLTKYIAVSTLPSRSDVSSTFVGFTATVSGWGKSSDTATSISPVLRYVSAPIISNTDCTKAYSIIQPSNICMSGAGGKSSCSGDSGGPLTTKINNVVKQIGIVSFGSSRGCEVGYPSAYTRVTSYLDWIQQNTDVIIT